MNGPDGHYFSCMVQMSTIEFRKLDPILQHLRKDRLTLQRTPDGNCFFGSMDIAMYQWYNFVLLNHYLISLCDREHCNETTSLYMGREGTPSSLLPAHANTSKDNCVRTGLKGVPNVQMTDPKIPGVHVCKSEFKIKTKFSLFVFRCICMLQTHIILELTYLWELVLVVPKMRYTVLISKVDTVG